MEFTGPMATIAKNDRIEAMKMTFGKRRVEYGDIEYDILIDGRKIGELKRYYDCVVYCCNSGLTEAGLDCSADRVRDAKADLQALWQDMPKARKADLVNRMTEDWGS